MLQLFRPRRAKPDTGYIAKRCFGSNGRLQRSQTRGKPELTMADAQHKPRISGMSFGLLISELNHNSFADTTRAFTALKGIPDSERASLRRIARWMLGFPIATVFFGIAAASIFRDGGDEDFSG